MELKNKLNQTIEIIDGIYSKRTSANYMTKADLEEVFSIKSETYEYMMINEEEVRYNEGWE